MKYFVNNHEQNKNNQGKSKKQIKKHCRPTAEYQRHCKVNETLCMDAIRVEKINDGKGNVHWCRQSKKGS